MIMETNVEARRSDGQPAGRAAVLRTGGRISRGMVMGHNERRRAQLQRPPQDRPRVERHFGRASGRGGFIAQQMVCRVQIKDMEALVRLMGKASMQISAQRLRR